MAAVYPFFLAVCSIVTILCNYIFNSRKVDDAIISFWGRASCWMFGVDVKVLGVENFPRNGFVALFNHTSFFDIFAMIGYLPGLRFGAKIELFRIPFFGTAMRRVGMLPIARQRREEAFKIYEATVDRIRQGERIALAPEGTRQVHINKLGAFKAGPFVLAINAKAPIVPVVIKEAVFILPKNSLFPNLGTWKRQITLQILPAIETQHMQLEDRPILQAKVLETMLPHVTAV